VCKKAHRREGVGELWFFSHTKLAIIPKWLARMQRYVFSYFYTGKGDKDFVKNKLMVDWILH